jgi:hypothetical protein
MEWFEDVSLIVNELGIGKESLRVDSVRILEVFLAAVESPLMD